MGKKLFSILSMVILMSIPGYTCSATANCACGGDVIVSLDGNQWPTCSCSKTDGEQGYVQCSGERSYVDNVSGEQITETISKRKSCSPCPPDDGGSGGGDGSGEGGDLSWCDSCYDENGVTTPLGDFFVLANS